MRKVIFSRVPLAVKVMNRENQHFLREIGFRIRERRIEMGLTQDELADRSDLHRTYVGAVERGERNVTILNLRRLAKSLRVATAQLLEGLDAAHRR